MPLTKVFKKILSVTLIGAFVMQQTGFVFAADVSSWDDLKTGVEGTPGEYNVTTALTADDNPNGTLNISANGNSVTGAALTENGTHDTLIDVNSGVTFGLGNNISGSIVNDGTLNYSGANLTDGSVTGNGALNFLATTVANANTITQGSVSVVGTSTLTNDANITATTFSNNGTVDNNAAITGSITNAGTLTSSATNLVGAVENNSTLNLEGGNVQAAISGLGDVFITGNLVNDYAIEQGSVTNNGSLENNATITTASFTNNDAVTGSGTLNINGDSTNNGSINQGLVAVDNNATFNNNGMLLAKASNASGSTINTDPDDLGDNVDNDGTLNLNNGGTLSVAVTGNGETNINGDLSNKGSISQTDINVASGVVVTSNASDMTASNQITNEGTINYTAGTTGNTIAGNGRVDITGYVINTGDIDQTTVSNSGIFTNNGTVTANVTNTNTIEGNGSLVTKDGISSNQGTIAQASLENNGTFDNGGHITLSDTLTNNGTFNTNADLIAANNGISNAGNLNVTGGTNTNVITGDGTTNFSNTATNNAAITQTTVINSGALTNNALITADVTNSGTLTSNGANIVGDIANTGSYIITDGDNANDIIGAGGNLSILGDTTNTGKIMQETLAIANSGSLTTNSDLVTASITNDGKLEWNDGAANENVISGSGQLDITGGDITNSASITQHKIEISDGSLTSNADLLALANGITNNAADGLTFTGGTNTNAIDGTGSTNIAGDVTNQATINQDNIDIVSGNLTTNANSVTTTSGITVSADAGISFNGGTNTNDISGQGTTYINGTVENTALISTKIGVSTDGHYATTQDIRNDLENNGITDITDANVAGDISGTGTLNILGSTENGANIVQSVVNVASNGYLESSSEKITATINNDGTYNIVAGTYNTNAISGNGSLVITDGEIVNSAAISQSDITINNGSLTSNADLLATVGGIKNQSVINITGGTNTNEITGDGTTNFSNTVTNNAAITQTTVTNSGTLTNNALITADDIINSGSLTSNGENIVGDITNDGSYIITGGNNANNISGIGMVTIQGTTTNTGTIHQDTIDIATGATLVAQDITNITTDNGIANAGTLEMQAGTNSNNISGDTGALLVTGNVNNNNGALINQGTIDISTLGEFTAYASDLTTVDGITNSGELSLNDGTNNNNISGDGTTYIIGDVNNYGAISQTLLDNTGTFVSDASLLAMSDKVVNSGTLELTGGTNNNMIEGSGHLDITGDLVNEGSITQETMANTANLTNNAAITATTSFENSGTVDNNAAITGNITNTGTINSSADNLIGEIASDGTLNISGGTVQGAITGTGEMNITGDLVNDYTIAQGTVNNSANLTNNNTIDADFNNSGVVDNSAAITGSIANTGTINSSADNLVGTIANDGTLNVNGGTVQEAISGTGEMNITGDLVNDYTIEQGSVTNDGNLDNNAAITADNITNNGVINSAAGDLVASNGIVNDGTLVFDTASTGTSDISGNGDVQVTADTTLQGNNTYTGGTLIDGVTLTVAGQDNLSTGDVSFDNDGVLAVTDEASLANTLKGVDATDHVTVQNDADLTLNGIIDNAADFHKSGAGTMTLAMASNGYTGDTYVDEGTLVGNTLNINNTVIGAADTTVEFNDTEDAELNAIDTLGTFIQSGNAVLNVEANDFTANQVDVNAGTFAANRALTANTLNVNDGATLRGNGNITGTVNVNNGGTIAPGNSVDTLTITGDVNFNSGSTTAIEINETPASDKIVITNNANIQNGANLTVSNENGRYFEWKEFEIINAGDVTGEFTYDGTVADYDTSRIDVELDYSDPTKVLLTAKRKATSHADTTGLSRNQGHVAQAMDAVSTGFGGDITNALLQLEQLAGLNPTGVTLIDESATLKSALNDLSGVLYANSALATLFNAKTAHVYDRIARRNPSTGKCPTCHDNVWAEYYSQYDKVYADANSPRFTNNMTGVLVGYDRSSDEALLGVYGGAGKSDLRQSHDKMDIDDVSLGIYAGYMPGNWMFKGTLFGGYQTYHGKRSINFMARSTEGKYHGWNLALDLEGGYNVALYDWLHLKPFVGVLGNYAHMESFTETGADSLNLHVESTDQFNTQARLGVQLDGKIGKRFSWYGSAAVKQFIGGDYAKLHMSLGLPGTRMEIISAELGRTYFSGQVGVSYALTDYWSVFGNIDAGVNNKSANCYGNIGLAYTW